jgi:hypothetical protein
MKNTFAFLLLIFVINQLNAQSELSGKVINAFSKEGIEFVSILLVGSLIGTSSGPDGAYTLPLPPDVKEGKIIFQRLGYKADTVLLADLLRKKTVELFPHEKLLDEVLITPIDPFKLLQQAIEKIPKNYYSPPLTQNAFYRQYIVANNELIGLEEADFSMINTFNKKPLDAPVSVKKSRGILDFEIIKSLGKMVEKSIKDDTLYIIDNTEMLRAFNPNYEAIQENKKGFLGEKGDKQYAYRYNGLVYKDEFIAHFISFDQKEKLKKTLFRGNVYIDTATLAVIQIEAELSPQGVDFQKLLPLKFRMLAKLLGFSIQIDDIRFMAHYHPHRGYWVLKDGAYMVKGSISKKNGVVIKGYFGAEYFVKENLPKTQYYNVRTPYEKILPDADDFRNKNFWDEANQFPMKKEIQTLLEKLLNQ